MEDLEDSLRRLLFEAGSVTKDLPFVFTGTDDGYEMIRIKGRRRCIEGFASKGPLLFSEELQTCAQPWDA
jgi:hypothetical protein